MSIQAQIINLLRDLKLRLGLTMLFISHDLVVVEYICDTVIVLYLGRTMEIAPAETLYANPRHPYTRALLSANPPSGGVFRARCPLAIEACAGAVPVLETVGTDHRSACIRNGEIAAGTIS